MEMARVTRVPIESLITRGQQNKVVSQLLRKVKADRYFRDFEFNNDFLFS